MSMYQLSNDSFQSIKKNLLLQLCLYQLIPCVVLSYLFSSMGSMKMVVPFLIFFFAIGFVKEFFKVKRREKEWTSFSIHLEDLAIKKTQFKSPDIHILFDEINRVVEIPNSGLSIQTNDSAKYLFIPIQLEGYEKVRQRLMTVKPIETSPVGVDNLQTFQSINQKKSFWKILMKESLKAIAPFFVFLVILFLVVLWVLYFLK
jgi:hypothetical protein